MKSEDFLPFFLILRSIKENPSLREERKSDRDRMTMTPLLHTLFMSLARLHLDASPFSKS